MRFTHLHLENWRNFRHVDVALQRRVFLVGPNASGKSNLLDALRFLREVADPQGGFQRAVSKRNGVSQIRSLHARREPDVLIDVTMELGSDVWRYCLAFSQDNHRRPLVRSESVWKGEERVLVRPDHLDESDPQRLTQTHLEQVNANQAFRSIADALGRVRYLHLVPQLIRDRERYVAEEADPFGGDFLEQLATLQREQKRTFDSRLRRINEALKVAVPQLSELKLERNDKGIPHLRGLYEHWRPNAGWQTEEQFSDGTLRLLGLLWSLLDGAAPLLLEEPELSLHAAVIRHLPALMWRLGRKTGRQTLVSTHSADLLSDESVAGEEVLLLEPGANGTEVHPASDDAQIRELLGSGLSAGEAVLPRTAPARASQLDLLFQE